MRFYRFHLYERTESSQAFEWFTTRKAAERARREYIRKNTTTEADAKDVPEVEVVDITPTRAGILAALNTYAEHPDNG